MPRLAELPLAAQPAVERHILEAAGEAGLALARLLERSGPLTDLQIIAAHPEQDGYKVRRTLYALQDARAAQYTKDTDWAGWDTFTWHLCVKDVADLLARRSQAGHGAASALDRAGDPTLASDPDATFVCGQGHARMAFSAAFDAGFLCQDCRGPLSAVASMEGSTVAQAAAARTEAIVAFHAPSEPAVEVAA